MVNDKTLKELKPKLNRYFKKLDENLFICVSPNGKKSFFVDFKDKLTGKRKREKIGEFSPFAQLKTPTHFKSASLTLKNARVKAVEFLENKAEIKAEFLTAWNEFYALKIAPTSEFYKIAVNRLFRNIFKPNFENLKVNEITKTHILNAMQNYILTAKYETAKRILTILRGFFNFAMTYGYTNENPALKIELKSIIKKPPTRHFATITNEQEIAHLLQNITEYNGNLLTKICAITQILTALRSLNVRSLKWSQIDLKNGIIKFQAEQMKNRTAFKITMPSQLLAILRKLRSLNFKSEFVFFSPKNMQTYLSENAVRSALRNMGYTNEQITPHGFRSMFSTICNENDKNAEIIELCLAHTDKNQIRATYNFAKKERQKAELWQWWANYLQNLSDYTEILP